MSLRVSASERKGTVCDVYALADHRPEQLAEHFELLNGVLGNAHFSFFDVRFWFIG